MSASYNVARPLLDYALGYARRGMAVLPLHSLQSGDCSCGRSDCSSAGKHPRTKNGVKDASRDLDQITRWWTDWPEANIGIATGTISSLYVIDIDSHKGASLEDLQAFGLDGLMRTLTANTGSGGYHFYLSCDRAWPNTSDRLGRAIDTRGEGGYVVAPPSRNRKGPYSWYNSQPVAAMPEALLARLREPALPSFVKASTVQAPERKEHPYETSQSQTHLSQNASRPEVSVSPAAKAPQTADATNAPPEARNTYLVGLAGTLRGRGMDLHQIRVALLATNEARYGDGKHPQGPLSAEEIERTILKSVAKWEAEGGVLPAAGPVVDDLSHLMRLELPPPVWIVPDLLPGGLAQLGGKPKLGKSWLALGLALTCALGTVNGDHRVLGRYAAEPVGVLYLSLEDNSRRFQERVNKLLAGRPVPERFSYALDWRMLTQGGLDDLDAWLTTAPDTHLVVIDTLAKVRMPTGTKGNTYQEDSLFMSGLHKLAMRQQICLLVVHHTRKQSSSDHADMHSGSTGNIGVVDTILTLDRARNQDEATLEITGRDIEEQKLALTFSRETATWTCTGSAADRQTSQARQEILDLLRDREPMTPAEIAKELGKPRNSVKVLLLRMRKEGVVSNEGDGRYTLSAE